MKLSRLLPLLALAFALTAAEKSPLVLDGSNRPSVITAVDVIRLPSTGPFFTGIYPTATADRDITLPDATTTLAGVSVAQTFTAAQTIQAATGITSLQAATQDAVRMLGRAGGSSSHVATITPPTLAGNVTITLPAATSALATLALTETFTNKTLTSPAINTATIIGGAINNASLGAATRNTAAVTTLAANGAVTMTAGTASTTTTTGTAVITGGVGISGALNVGGVMKGSQAWGSLGTIVSNAAAIYADGTWNNAASAFSAMQIDITDTASSSASQLMNLRTDGVSRFVVRKDGSALIAAAGGGIYIKEGTNATMGTATLVAGTVVVSTTKVTATSRIQITGNSDGGTPGWLRVSARTAGTSFTITSSSGTDTGTVGWVIVEPAP